MNNQTNENTKPLPKQGVPAAADTQTTAVQQSHSEEADQPLKQFFEDAAEKSVTEQHDEDPFFSPLPDIPMDDDAAADDAFDAEASDAAQESSPEDTADAPNDAETEPASDEKSDAETTYIAEHTLAEEDAAAVSEPSSTDEETEQHTDGSDARPRRKTGKVIGIAAGAVGGVLLLTFTVLCIILFRLSGPVTVDLDETVSLGALETHPILSALTEAEPAPSAIDTSALGEKQIALTFFGFLPRTVTVYVCDLTPPEVSAYHMTVFVGAALTPEDCVLSCNDKTAVTHVFGDAPDTSSPGERGCTLLSTDAGGNTVETPVVLTVSSEACTQHAEFGVDEAAVSALFASIYPAYPTFDMTAVDYTACGSYRVTAETAEERAILLLVLADTTAPKGTKHNFNLLSGTTLTPEDFVTDIKDASEVTLRFEKAPDYDSLAPQTVTVLASDAHGNETKFTCVLQMWNITNELTVECGTALDDLCSTLFSEMSDAGAALPTFDQSFDPLTLAPGTYNIRLHGAYSTPTVALTMVDTVPPKLTVKPMTVYIGHALTPDLLCETVEDATEVKLSFAAEPDVSKAGSVNVTVIAEDAGGNKTEAQTTVTVIADTAAPQIYGVKTIYAQHNGTVSYRSGVSAYDNADGTVSVRVDASGVDLTKIGKYTVIYTATDRAGNTATQSAYVYVTGADLASVNLYADEILAVILSPGMTDTQKAHAIYTWCVGHLRYSTATSHLMGKFLEAAYSGFTKHIGNCYTYYAVASVLLTRAGIENIEIQRDNPYAPHYWNLVKINGNWYHLDTCPKWKSHPIKTFLLTDRQVRDYSLYELEGYYSFDASRYPATP